MTEGVLTINSDGTVSEAPDVIHVTLELIRSVDPSLLRVEGGRIIFGAVREVSYLVMGVEAHGVLECWRERTPNSP